MDTAFSYQGRLSDAGIPAAGDYDFRFLLYTADVGGSQVGPILYGDDTQVIDGFFTIYLDFGAGVFDGTDLWLEVSVRNGGSTGSYTPLAPRQSILPSPYSLYSARITWDFIEGMPPDFADGVDDDTTYAAGNQLDLVGDTFDVVEGSGSGLDADTVDGQDSAAFAPSFAAGDGLDLAGGILSVDATDFNTTPQTAQSSSSPAVDSTSWITLHSDSITAPPVAGRVVAIASTESRCVDCPGGDSGAIYFGLTTSSTGTPSSWSRMYTGSDSGVIYTESTVFQVYSVAADSQTTVYLRSRSESSDDYFFVYSPRILLFFVPN